jgi:hypothetical protein
MGWAGHIACKGNEKYTVGKLPERLGHEIGGKYENGSQRNKVWGCGSD